MQNYFWFTMTNTLRHAGLRNRCAQTPAANVPSQRARASCSLPLSGSRVGRLRDTRICSLTALGKAQFKLVLFSCSFPRNEGKP